MGGVSMVRVLKKSLPPAEYIDRALLYLLVSYTDQCRWYPTGFRGWVVDEEFWL